jgi:hypothetical protein
MDDADAEVVLAHIHHAQLAIRWTGRRVLQHVVDFELGDVEGDGRSGAVLCRRHGAPRGQREEEEDDQGRSHSGEAGRQSTSTSNPPQ